MERLKEGGYVIIATPLMWKGFWWDFDHIKPYTPIGIRMVFEGNDAQVQYYSSNTLRLVDIWFRRDPFMLHYYRSLYVKSRLKYMTVIVNKLFQMIYTISLGLVGQVNGWMALYEKK